jgi:glutamate/tyrosine decarboxylase-like PLP-dependent enzyme
LAFDFHKWLHVNYDAGCVLIRDGDAHLRAFSERPDYLKGAERGLAAGSPWPVDYGPELSRGFRALKVWSHLLEHGTEKLGAAITRNCEQARYLGKIVAAKADVELLAPVALNIVCFRFAPAGVADLDALNDNIVVELQESGIAAPSTTRIAGTLAIRINITNHRTRFSDLDLLMSEVERIGRGLAG